MNRLSSVGAMIWDCCANRSVNERPSSSVLAHELRSAEPSPVVFGAGARGSRHGRKGRGGEKQELRRVCGSGLKAGMWRSRRCRRMFSIHAVNPHSWHFPVPAGLGRIRCKSWTCLPLLLGFSGVRQVKVATMQLDSFPQSQTGTAFYLKTNYGFL